MTRPYRNEQREQYLIMTDAVGKKHWLEIFEGNSEFYSAVYWDLFTELWRAHGRVKKTDAIDFMKRVSRATASKHLDKAIKYKMIREVINKNDKRIRELELSPQLRKRIENFLDNAIDELEQSYCRVFDKHYNYQDSL